MKHYAALLLLPLFAAAAPLSKPDLARWYSVADHLSRTCPCTFQYNWGEGVQAIGMMKIFERTHKAAYANWVDQWLTIYIPKGIRDLLKMDPAPDLPKPGPGYCGYWSPAAASLYLYEARKKPEDLRLAEETATFIENGASRSPEGALAHWTGNRQLWVDTLYMACPVLAGVGKLEQKPAYVEDAARQLLLYAKHNQDPKSGLFYHMWDWETGQHSAELWGRGNGWVLMSIADTMEAMNAGDKDYGPLRKLAGQIAEGLAATEDASGLWHTVLNDPSSYPESSATSMFVYGLLKLHRLGVLPASVMPMALKAWRAVDERYVQDGIVTGVSAGTEPKSSQYYRKIPVGSQTWGTGAYLMAGSEIDQLH